MPVNVALIEKTKSGKSTVINSLRNLYDGTAVDVKYVHLSQIHTIKLNVKFILNRKHLILFLLLIIFWLKERKLEAF